MGETMRFTGKRGKNCPQTALGHEFPACPNLNLESLSPARPIFFKMLICSARP